MIKKIFFILEGNNGATYILNAKNKNNIDYSLKFYKARTVKQKVFKSLLKIYLKSLTFIKSSKLKNINDINQYLEKLTNLTIDFELDENCSILVSPTRNKIIVNHHGCYFHKFAFGDSYSNVKNEANIYKLLNKPLQNFKVSKFYDFINIENKLCSFKLKNQLDTKNSNMDIPLALIEMFNISKQDKYLFGLYLDNLKNRYEKSVIKCEAINNILNKLKMTNKNKFISFGLVHRDFKHWNMNIESGLLIYDFEEAIVTGPPLEDLLNYHIAPIINYFSSSEVITKIFLQENVNDYNRYLEKLKININFKALLYCYVIEKILFYQQVVDSEIRSKYIELLKKIIEKKGYQ